MKRGILLISILVSVGLVFFISGCCAKKQSVTSTPVTQAEETVVEEVIVLEEGDSVLAEILEEMAPLTGNHVVKSGECLWWIAEYENIYNDPFMWPLIYNTNKDKINNPDLIYPGQTLDIPRSGYTMDEVREARRLAGAPRPYTPPEGSVPPVD
ncbi:MAG: LysM peptidoglycan-binding domain-containing protein [Deltaproteobacteria bacterium]|nr:LysM peptidoglycan-binding domain-containing protein [Deltaproteobacteria bacterium]